MVKQAPSLGRISAMVLFALSCFGLLLFLWVSFGGPTPLKPQGYRIEVAFPEATQLAEEADVRVAGVEVGKVRGKRRDPAGNATLATLEIDPRYAPVASDARVTLRQKTLLGETYVELTTGSDDADPVPEGGRLDSRNVRDTVELDEILNTLDPYTRQAFRVWQQSAAGAIRGRGPDVNDTFGSLPGFADGTADLMQVLDRQRSALRGVVRDTGVVFSALTRREGQLRALIENSDTVFTAIQRERESFAELFQVFPTFLDESRKTFGRLETFSQDTRPLVRDLKPAFDDLGPTLRAVGEFGPDLQRLFQSIDPLIAISRKSLPAQREVFRALRPLLAELHPWLGEFNPTIGWIAEHQATLVDLFANLGVATAAKTGSVTPGAPGHYLRQFGPTGLETVSIHRNRLASNRGNAYFHPYGVIQKKETAQAGILPSFDCLNTPEGTDRPAGGTPAGPACRTQEPYKGARFPRIKREDYLTPTAK